MFKTARPLPPILFAAILILLALSLAGKPARLLAAGQSTSAQHSMKQRNLQSAERLAPAPRVEAEPAMATDRQEDDEPPKLPDPNAPAWRLWATLDQTTRAKVDPRILNEFRGLVRPAHLGNASNTSTPLRPALPRGQTRFLVHMVQQTDVRALSEQVYASQLDQRNAVFQSLVTTARESQAAVRSSLDARVSTGQADGYQSFYVINALAVEGDLATLIDLARRPDVAHISANYPLVPLWDTTARPSPAPAQQPFPEPELDDSNWNIEMVRADDVWNELNITGRGVVVAGFDTGVYLAHPALQHSYRGRLDDGRFVHDYNWFEPDSRLYPDGNYGPSLSEQPMDCDFYSTHGTHTMGTMVGDGGEPGTHIGMAPGARWIAVPGICYGTMSGLRGDDIGGLKAFQWLMCPTDLSGDLSTADCSLAPDVINNSWGSANPTNDLFRPVIATLRAMGIAPVFAAGNPYAGPGSIGAPANAPEAIAVGATDHLDIVAEFSGRGPSFYEGERKPELSAPGVDVQSSVAGFFMGYDYLSGTSMAAPHVAGLIALMVEADLRDGVRDLDVNELERFMAYTAKDLGTPGPDDDYGAGRIDAYRAVQWVLSAGDLRGVVRSSAGNAPITGAQVTGQSRSGDGNFVTLTDGTGVYSTTVPGGQYDVTVSAWGHVTKTFSLQQVVPDAYAVADFVLEPLPTVLLTGLVRNENGPVAGAVIRPTAPSLLRTISDAGGVFTLELPVGEHELTVEATGHRLLRRTVSVGSSGGAVEFQLDAAPKLLVVDADARLGWFSGWPVHTIFGWALEQSGYTYDFWPIQSTSITNTTTLEDGSIGYGLPDLTTLAAYDAVIWIHTGCDGWGYQCLEALGNTMTDRLQAYLESGGRLILSGQNLTAYDDGSAFFDRYVRVDLVVGNAAEEGSRLVGSGFLEGLTVELTNASLYGHQNGSYSLSPDAVRAQTRTPDADPDWPPVPNTVSYPVLSYEDVGHAAALAVQGCSPGYRLVLYAMGYENIGPRAAERSPEIAAVLDRSLEWLVQPIADQGLALAVDQHANQAEPGRSTDYAVTLANTGGQGITVDVTPTSLWPTTVYSGSQPLTGPIEVGPCGSATLSMRVSVPPETESGARESTRIQVRQADQVLASTTVTTTAFAAWHTVPREAQTRFQMGVAAMPGTPEIYAVGGLYNEYYGEFDGYYFMSSINERYNICTREWTAGAPLPEALGNPMAVALDGKLYVMGTRESWDYPFITGASLYIYDPAQDVWSPGTPMPDPVGSAAAVAVDGRIYVFGGYGDGGVSDQTAIYDPAQDAWSIGAPMPGGPRAETAAAVRDGRVYVVGGYPNLDRVEIYDPATNQWGEGPALQFSRHNAGLAAADDGYLYLLGGATQGVDLNVTERLGPDDEAWETIGRLNDPYRDGVRAAHLGGTIYALGGYGASIEMETLKLIGSFCDSDQSLERNVIELGQPLTVTLQLVPEQDDLDNVSLVDHLPVKTTFLGFHANPVDAVYDATARQVRWNGSLPGGTRATEIVYILQTNQEEWQPGEAITNTVNFAAGAGTPYGPSVAFTRTLVAQVTLPDFRASRKQVEPTTALSGDMLTYTLDLRSFSFAGGQVTLEDILPPEVELAPDSIQIPYGDVAYEAATRTLSWSGLVQSARNALANLTSNYIWVDNVAETEDQTVRFEWIDISGSGERLPGGDDLYHCDLPLPFAFPFFGATHLRFCASTNGFISFDNNGGSDYTNDCPLPSSLGNESIIAGVWGDFVVEDAIYYQSFGQAPNRHVVVQWQEMRPYLYPSQESTSFQIILYESGDIKVQILDAGYGQGGDSTTGLEDAHAEKGVTYACNRPRSLQDRQAIMFLPPGNSIGVAGATIRYQTRVSDDIGANRNVTNRVVINSPKLTLERMADVLLNSVDLGGSTVSVAPAEVTPNHTVQMEYLLRNRGVMTATAATLRVPLPESLALVDGSLTCSVGRCTHEAGMVSWNGAVAPRVPTTVTFAARLTMPLPDRTTVRILAEVEDGFGSNAVPLRSQIMARRADLGGSRFQLSPAYLEPGERTILNILVRNRGKESTDGRIQVEIPAPLVVVEGSLACGAGTCQLDGSVVRWEGSIPARSLIPIRVGIKTPDEAVYGDAYLLPVTLDDLLWAETSNVTLRLAITRQSWFPQIDGRQPLENPIYLPLTGFEDE